MTDYFPVPGTHLLIDFWGASNLDDITLIEQALSQAALACNATILKINLHSFGEKSGITGVALLAESHISIHTWPEINFVALDVFMCGGCNPHQALPIFEQYFKPERKKITETFRGETE